MPERRKSENAVAVKSKTVVLEPKKSHRKEGLTNGVSVSLASGEKTSTDIHTSNTNGSNGEGSPKFIVNGGGFLECDSEADGAEGASASSGIPAKELTDKSSNAAPVERILKQDLLISLSRYGQCSPSSRRVTSTPLESDKKSTPSATPAFTVQSETTLHTSTDGEGLTLEESLMTAINDPDIFRAILLHQYQKQHRAACEAADHGGNDNANHRGGCKKHRNAPEAALNGPAVTSPSGGEAGKEGGQRRQDKTDAGEGAEGAVRSGSLVVAAAASSSSSGGGNARPPTTPPASTASFELPADFSEWFWSMIKSVEESEASIFSHLQPFAFNDGKGPTDKEEEESRTDGTLTLKNDRIRQASGLNSTRDQNDMKAAFLRIAMGRAEEMKNECPSRSMAGILSGLQKLGMIRSVSGEAKERDGVVPASASVHTPTPAPTPATETTSVKSNKDSYAMLDDIVKDSDTDDMPSPRSMFIDALTTIRLSNIARGGGKFIKAAGDPDTEALDDFRLRAMCLSALSPWTLAEVVERTKVFAEIYNDTPSLTETTHYMVVAYWLGEATLAAAYMLYRYYSAKQADPNNQHPVEITSTYGAPQVDLNELTKHLKRDLSKLQIRLNPLLSLLVHHLRQLSRESLQQLATYANVEVCDAIEVYNAISTVGAALFFSVLPLPLLVNICDELGISTSGEATMDKHLLTEVLAEKIGMRLYPSRPTTTRIALSHIVYVPRLLVHEHAPGSYTCTIDNAGVLGRLPLERIVSNRFSCGKVRWRGELLQERGNLSFRVWHRHSTPLQVRFLLHSSDRRRKRKGRGGATPQPNEGTPESAPEVVEAVEDGAAGPAPGLHLETKDVVQPGELFGLVNFVKLKAALSASAASTTGLRTYSKIEDRLIFQLALEVDNMGDTPNSGALATKSSGTAEDEAKGAKSAAAADGDSSERQKKHEARVERLCSSEAGERQEIESVFTTSFTQLQNVERREAQRAAQRAIDRERKALLAKAGPAPELVREVEKLTQTIQNARQQVNKLHREKTKQEKESDKVSEKIKHHREMLAELESTIESNQRLINKFEGQIGTLQERSAARARRNRQRNQERLTPDNGTSKWMDFKRAFETPSTTHHDTLAINDLERFLTPEYHQAPSVPPPPSGDPTPSTGPYSMLNLMNLFSTSPAASASPWAATTPHPIPGEQASSTTSLSGAAPPRNGASRNRSPLSAVTPHSGGLPNGSSHTIHSLSEAVTAAGVIGGPTSTSSSGAGGGGGAFGAGPDPYLFSTRQSPGLSARLSPSSQSPSTAHVFSTHPKGAAPPRAVSEDHPGGAAGEDAPHGFANRSASREPRPLAGVHPRTASLPFGYGLGSPPQPAMGMGMPPGFRATAPPPPGSPSVFSQLDVNARPFNPPSISAAVTPPPSWSGPPVASAAGGGGGGPLAAKAAASFAFTVTGSPLHLSLGTFAGGNALGAAETAFPLNGGGGTGHATPHPGLSQAGIGHNPVNDPGVGFIPPSVWN